MTRCPISYEASRPGEYSARGLKMLSRRLKGLGDLPFSSEGLRQESLARADKMSIQGVQPKLSAVLRVAQEKFKVVDVGGTFILKPQINDYRHIPENEDVTMRMARAAGIEVPLHGMIYTAGGALCYFIRRFDRLPRRRKRPVEDFAQLLGRSRDTKYDSSVEQIVAGINTYCTFPVLENVKLFRRILFSFLIGNEDAHLKNYSVITRDGQVTLSPAYDLLNTTIVLTNVREESALRLRGKKFNLAIEDFTDYLARDRMGLRDPVIERVLTELRESLPDMYRLLSRSFLPPDLREAYICLLKERSERLELSR